MAKVAAEAFETVPHAGGEPDPSGLCAFLGVECLPLSVCLSHTHTYSQTQTPWVSPNILVP